MGLFSWIAGLFGRRGGAPKAGEVAGVDKTRKELSARRERLLYEAMELDEEIQRLFKKYKETDTELLKQDLLRTLTIKRAAYESLDARLGKLGDAELAMTRRSAFLQSFLDLPEITESDLDRLQELQQTRKEQERRAVVFTDQVIGLTDMAPERSERAERLGEQTVAKLEAEERARRERDEAARGATQKEGTAAKEKAAERESAPAAGEKKKAPAAQERKAPADHLAEAEAALEEEGA